MEQVLSAFIFPPGARAISEYPRFCPATSQRRPSVVMSERRSNSKRLSLLQAALIAGGSLAGYVCGPNKHILTPVRETHAVAANVTKTRSANDPLPLKVLGVKREEFVSERELRRRKTTLYSEAEQEIMELEEWEVETQWFRDLQALWAGLASIAGIYVLYKGGVMWENWIKEQERKDMEEEIELTGTFIDPRAVRKDEDDNGTKQNKTDKPKKGPQSSGGEGGESPSGGIDSLEKLFGQS